MRERNYLLLGVIYLTTTSPVQEPSFKRENHDILTYQVGLIRGALVLTSGRTGASRCSGKHLDSNPERCVCRRFVVGAARIQDLKWEPRFRAPKTLRQGREGGLSSGQTKERFCVVDRFGNGSEIERSSAAVSLYHGETI